MFVMMAAEAFCAKVPSLTECILLVLHKALRAAAAAVPGGAGLGMGSQGPRAEMSGRAVSGGARPACREWPRQMRPEKKHQPRRGAGAEMR